MAFDWALLGAAAAGGFVSGGMNWASSANLNKKNREWQEKMWLKNVEHQEDFYLKYQSPEAMMKSQLAGAEAVGINPAMLMEGVPTDGQSPAASPNTPSPATQNGNFFGDLGSSLVNAYQAAKQSEKIHAEINLLNEQKNKVAAEKLLINKQTYLVGEQGTSQYLQNVLDAATMSSKTQKAFYEMGISYEQKIKLIRENEVYKAQMEDLKKMAKLDAEIKEKQKSLLDKEIEIATKDIDIKGMQKGQIQQATNLLLAQTAAQELSNEINTYLKEVTKENAETNMTFETFWKNFCQEYQEKHGYNPALMDSFDVMMIDALSGVGDMESSNKFQNLMQSQNPFHWKNIALGLMRQGVDGIFSLGSAAIAAGALTSTAAAAIPVAPPSLYQGWSVSPSSEQILY